MTQDAEGFPISLGAPRSESGSGKPGESESSVLHPDLIRFDEMVDDAYIKQERRKDPVSGKDLGYEFTRDEIEERLRKRHPGIAQLEESLRPQAPPVETPALYGSGFSGQTPGTQSPQNDYLNSGASMPPTAQPVRPGMPEMSSGMPAGMEESMTQNRLQAQSWLAIRDGLESEPAIAAALERNPNFTKPMLDELKSVITEYHAEFEAGRDPDQHKPELFDAIKRIRQEIEKIPAGGNYARPVPPARMTYPMYGIHQ